MTAPRPTLWAAVLTAALGAEVVLFAVLLRGSTPTHYGQAELLAAVAIPVWLAAVLALARSRLSGRRAVLVVLGASAVLQVVALTHPPATSDDDYRYQWDAKVQLAGVDPYRYAPAAPELARLREPSLFGAPSHCTHAFAGGCTSINRPTVRTIYPPVAEAAFDVVRIVSFGGHGGPRPLQIAALLGCLAVGALLLRRRPPWWAAMWAWCPVVISEYANNAHIDWLAVLLVVMGLTARGVRTAGALVGAAIAVKLYPVLVLPSLMRRSWTAAVAALAVVVIGYVPHVVAVGRAVIGYLPGYLREEQYGSGNRLLLIGAVLPDAGATAIGALLVAGAGLWAWRRGSPAAPEQSAVLVVGVAFLVFTPRYGWYAGLLIALVALSGAFEWLPVAVAPTFVYLDRSGHPAVFYAVAAVLTAALWCGRRRWGAGRAGGRWLSSAGAAGATASARAP